MVRKLSIGMGASEERLEKLVQERLKTGADTKMIDQRIWDLFGEQWAIMFTDLSGFSRGVAQYGIIHFLQMIHESHRLLIPVLDDHDGILLKQEGDSLLVIFRNVNKALQASIDMQKLLLDYNRDKADTDQVLLCVGLGVGDVLKIGDADVFGAEVNAASKLGEDMAEPWEILVTDAVRQSVGELPGISYTELEDPPSGAERAFRVHYPL
jgi:class 3 adenylate cyclase